MSANNDLISITHYLKEEKINLDFEEFEFQVSSHPDFPSLLAYSDALAFFKVPNVATRIDKEQVDILPDNFLALLLHEEHGEILTSVKRKGNQFACSFGKAKEELSKEEFLKSWDNIVMLAEQGEETPQTSTKSQGRGIAVGLVFLSMLLFVGYALWSGISYLNLGFLALIMAGGYFSLEALKQNLGIESPATSKFCNASPTTSCDSVINSDKSALFKSISLTDMCVLFSSSLILNYIAFYILGHIDSYFTVLSLGMWLILPIGLYSVYFQWRVEKRWCPICLSILGIVLLQAIFVYAVYGNPLEALSGMAFPLAVFAVSTLFLTGLWYLIKPSLFENKTLKEFQLKALRFKRNYKLFKLALDQEEEIQLFTGGSPLILGNANAPLTLHFITNPYCKYCKDAHAVIEDLLQTYGDVVRVAIGFNFNATEFKKYAETEAVAKERLFLHRTLVDIYKQEGETQFTKAIGEWFQEKNMETWKAKYFRHIDNLDLVDSILDAQDEWNRQNQLNFTPALVVGTKMFPVDYYEVKDIKYFITDLMEEINEQSLSEVNA
jgi:protein-disulfide isomerase/uncharacterized membrane protein